MTKGVRSGSVAVLLLWLWAAPAAARFVEGVVAVVNGEPITFSEYRESVAEGLGISPGDADLHLREERDANRILQGLEPLIDSVLVRQELSKLGQPVTPEEVLRAIESVRTANGLTEEQFREALARDGIPFDQYRRRVRWQMERGAIVRAMRMKEVTVTEEEAKEYFRSCGDRFLEGAEVRLATLYLPLPANRPPAEAEYLLRVGAQRATELVGSGADFGETAKLLEPFLPGATVVESDFVPSADLLPRIQEEIRRLETGETSPPFFTESGGHLVRVLARRGGSRPDFSRVKGEIQEELLNRLSEKAYTNILTELKKSAVIDIRL